MYNFFVKQLLIQSTVLMIYNYQKYGDKYSDKYAK